MCGTLRGKVLCALAVAGVVNGSWVTRAEGANKAWVGPNNGAWSGPGNWSLPGIPLAADAVIVQNSAAVNAMTVVFDDNNGFVYGSVLVDPVIQPAGSATLFQNSFGLSALVEIVGTGGQATHTHLAATNTILNLLTLGDGSAGKGTYNLNQMLAGQADLNGTTEIIGNAGIGVFNHYLRGNTMTSLFVGYQPTGMGTYNLYDGVLSATNETIGNAGTGVVNQAGGNNIVAGTIKTAASSGSSGVYNLQGGMLMGNFTNNGTFNYTGGNYTGNLTNNGLTNIAGVLPLVIGGNVTNNGNMKVTGIPLTITGIYSGFGSLVLDPIYMKFEAGATVSTGGSILSGPGNTIEFMSTLDNHSTFQNAGDLIAHGNVTNSGDFTQSGGQVWSPGVVFTNTDGNATFASNAGTTAASPLSVVGQGGTVHFASIQHVNLVSIDFCKVVIDTGVTKTHHITFGGVFNAWTGQLDCREAALVAQYPDAQQKAANLPAVQNQMTTGRHGGVWDGNGITSSSVLGKPGFTLALADNADLHLQTFGGQVLDDNALIIVFVHLGDATLDHKVDALDLNMLAAHWQQQQGAMWSDGDFTGDGKVDALDLNMLAAYWQYNGAQNLVAAAVPEGRTIGVLAGIVPILTRKRRRRMR